MRLPPASSVSILLIVDDSLSVYGSLGFFDADCSSRIHRDFSMLTSKGGRKKGTDSQVTKNRDTPEVVSARQNIGFGGKAHSHPVEARHAVLLQ